MTNISLEIEKIRKKIEKRGYYLNPDNTMTEPLVEALFINQKRYDYPFCPCRLASENYEEDKDLICPCDYRDQDIDEYDACFCGLYVSKEVFEGKKNVNPIPERRGDIQEKNKVWRCNVCGYLCARTHAPNVCPICGVTHDRFKEYYIK